MTREALSANLSLETGSGSDSTPDPGSAVLGGPETPGRAVVDRALHGTADPATLPHQCRCGARWSGGRTCHCGSCHFTFGGVTHFDAHRRGGLCLTVADLGLTRLPGRAYECWGNTDESETP